MYKTMQVAEYNMAEAESAPQANVRYVCVIHPTVGQYFNDIEHRIGLSAIAEPLVIVVIVFQ